MSNDYIRILERYILGCLFLEPTLLLSKHSSRLIHYKEFQIQKHKDIFDCMTRCFVRYHHLCPLLVYVMQENMNKVDDFSQEDVYECVDGCLLDCFDAYVDMHRRLSRKQLKLVKG